MAANIQVTGSLAGGDLVVNFFDGPIATGNQYSGLEAEALQAMVADHYKGDTTTTVDAAAIEALFAGDLSAAATDLSAKVDTLAESNILTFDVGGLTDSIGDKAILNSVYASVDATLQTMTEAATDLGSAKARVDMQKQFASDLSDAIDRGIGQLVDADMNEESTRLKALQTQQQLGIQALSIANNASQNILSLFR